MPRVTFLHPDLGIGGAERLVVDAALGLKNHGNTVNIITTHHDKSHAFDETLNGEIPVFVVGDWIPRSIFKRFHALMAYIRMIYAAIYIIFFSDLKPDVVFCDLVSVAIPILRLRIRHVIFYCHFPDQLLSQSTGRLKALYRAPINWLEEISTGKASKIFVNSKFTASVFEKTFKSIEKRPDILYPSLNMSFFDSFNEYSVPKTLGEFINQDTLCFLSINRYERKKNLGLAIRALSNLQNLIDETSWNNVHLIMTGGYDSRIAENVEHFEELTNLRRELNLDSKVTLLRSMSDNEKISLLNMSICLIYTPSNEHFGIVPIEAMYMRKPVIAANSGGPMETIINGETGFLCSPTPQEFADAMKKFVTYKNLSKEFGARGRQRVTSIFSFDKFSSQLNDAVKELLSEKKEN